MFKKTSSSETPACAVSLLKCNSWSILRNSSLLIDSYNTYSHRFLIYIFGYAAIYGALTMER